jgi:hypothetical protein
MSIRIASSAKATIEEAVQELKASFTVIDCKMMVFFASPKYVPDEICIQMQGAFPGATVFGCSTAGEIVSGKMLDGAVVAMAFDEEAMPGVTIEVLENLSREIDVSESFRSFENHFGEPMVEMDPSRYVGILLTDGLNGAEEKLMETLGDKTNVLFIGGSAGDDLKFESTHVYANGKAYTDAAVLALLKPGMSFDFIKTQSVRDLGVELVVTRANSSRREVVELNNIPASTAYAKALGVSINELTGYFPTNPLGLIIDGDPYVRSPRGIEGDSVFFHCSSVEGMTLSLLETANMIEDTRMDLTAAGDRLGGISGLIVFNCAHRALELANKHLSGEYGEVFADIPTIGFNSYGEQYIGHMNQTATMLVFASSPVPEGAAS